jgi:gluconate kinase
MVFIIAGTAESGRNTVGRLLAEALGWEYIDAENLRPSGNLEAHRCSASLANADPSLRTGTLSAAINVWIYEWRDVVVSCPVLTAGERRQLLRMSSLVKIVCLEDLHATGCNRFLDRSVGVASFPSPAGSDVGRIPERSVFTLDSSRKVEDIIAEMTSVLMM